MFWPCETRTSICRNLATISSGLYRFLAITVLLDVKDIPQVGPLQWGWITAADIAKRIWVAQTEAGGRNFHTGGGKVVGMEGPPPPKRVAITEWESLEK